MNAVNDVNDVNAVNIVNVVNVVSPKGYRIPSINGMRIAIVLQKHP